MPSRARVIAFAFLLLSAWSQAEHVIVAGGPALRLWEDLRVSEDRHDRWWANFIRASTLRIDEIRRAYGTGVPVVWMVYQPAYQARGREDGKPYLTWIADQAREAWGDFGVVQQRRRFPQSAQFQATRCGENL